MAKTIEERFGKCVSDMTDGEWRMAVVQMFGGVNDRLDITNGSIKEIPKIKARVSKMWIAGGIYGLVILSGLMWIFNTLINHTMK